MGDPKYIEHNPNDWSILRDHIIPVGLDNETVEGLFVQEPASDSDKVSRSCEYHCLGDKPGQMITFRDNSNGEQEITVASLDIPMIPEALNSAVSTPGFGSGFIVNMVLRPRSIGKVLRPTGDSISSEINYNWNCDGIGKLFEYGLLKGEQNNITQPGEYYRARVTYGNVEFIYSRNRGGTAEAIYFPFSSVPASMRLEFDHKRYIFVAQLRLGLGIKYKISGYNDLYTDICNGTKFITADKINAISTVHVGQIH